METKKSAVPDKLSPQEEAEMRELQANTIKFYEEHLPILRLQEEFETLNAKISQSRLHRVMADHKLAEVQGTQIPEKKQG